MEQTDPLVSAPQFRKNVGGVSTMTIWRWLRIPNDPLPAPAAIIAGRRFWRKSDLDAWLARHAPASRAGEPRKGAAHDRP